MISDAKRKKIYIHITTYKRNCDFNQENEMNEKPNKKCLKDQNKYICASCLNNSKTEDRSKECCKKMTKCCPICLKTGPTCQKNYDHCTTNKKDKDRIVTVNEMPVCHEVPIAKTVQTSDVNVAQGLSLLNEVLTVFQNKKVDMNKEKVKSGLLKDVAVSTDQKNEEKNLKDRSRLTVSTFQYSIDNTKRAENGKFTIVNCCQPDFVKKQHSIDLIKHKSSSIPQMKLEELKYSLKEKSRSKDAIEEVNRMFATVRKPSKHIENSNRPMVRNGPRVLPVVKNNTYQENKKDFGTECNNRHICKCCQTCMSSGDSFIKPIECCHGSEKETCDKCVYMLCCHYENKRKRHTGVLICEHCKTLNEEHYNQNESYVDDSC